MVEAKLSNDQDHFEKLVKKYQETERELRELELDRMDYILSLKSLVQALHLVLAHNDTPAHLDEMVLNFLEFLNSGQETKHSQVAEFSEKLLAAFRVAREDPTQNIDPSPETVFAESNVAKFLSQLGNFRGGRYNEDSKNILRLMQIGASITTFLGSLGQLLVTFFNDTQNDRVESSAKISTIIKTLINLENEFRRFIEQSISYIGTNNRNFTNRIASHVNIIQKKLEETESDPEKLLGFLADEVETISASIHQKNEEDKRHLLSMREDESNLGHSLNDIRRDYDSFVQQSNLILREMEEMRAIALKDALTGVYNRRAYDETLLLTLLNHKAGKLVTFSLIIFDIDLFRDVNNNYGHQAGDKILFSVAQIVTSTLRANDFVFRYGGDEFIIILPGADLQDAFKVAEKLRENVHNVEYHLTKNDDKFIKVSVSMGVAEVKSGDGPESILARADKALYVAKNKGRNMVCIEES
ncbi:MAG: GGDEF domain-containing protein [Deltaproteobacteria bacterium]|jgi:diguanylate cyclase (GGDEF)-like protein|nr:GGDEF domain-containing protein [Deltaproteobacteria bacterium]